MTTKISMRELLEAGVHFGHQTKRWNPKMRPYIYGARNGIYIINLKKTLPLYNRAVNFIKTAVSRGETVLFVGTKRQAQLVMEEEAQRAKMPSVTHRWLGGMLTNFITIRKSVDRIDGIDKLLAEGSVERLQKKEVLRLEKERVKLLRNLSGIREMNRRPGVLFLVDPRKEQIALAEARRLNIPVVALVDTNCNPDDIDYVIPGNDDAIRTIRLFANRIANACIEGRDLHKQSMIRELDKSAHTDFEQGATESHVVTDENMPEVIIKRPASQEQTAEPTT